MYQFESKKPVRKKYRDGPVAEDRWKTLVTLTSTITDDADPDFGPYTKSASGYPVGIAGLKLLGDDLVAKFNRCIANYEAEKAAEVIEDAALGGKILDKLNNYLVTNVGV